MWCSRGLVEQSVCVRLVPVYYVVCILCTHIHTMYMYPHHAHNMHTSCAPTNIHIYTQGRFVMRQSTITWVSNSHGGMTWSHWGTCWCIFSSTSVCREHVSVCREHVSVWICTLSIVCVCAFRCILFVCPRSSCSNIHTPHPLKAPTNEKPRKSTTTYKTTTYIHDQSRSSGVDCHGRG